MESFHKRKFVTFISHAHADKRLVDYIESWLTEIAGIPVWYDARYLPAGSKIASDLGRAIVHCRSMIIVLSKQSIESGWVKEEFDLAVDQRAQSMGEFRIIPIRIEDCEVPPFLRTTKWIDILDQNFDLEAASELLLSLYGADIDLELGQAMDVFVSRSWRLSPQSEPALADAVCAAAIRDGFRLIGDSEDQQGFDEGARVESIISSCGGFVAILPDRGGGKTSKYMLQEIEIAHNLNVPIIMVAEESVDVPTGLADKPIGTVVITKSDIDDKAIVERNVQPLLATLKDSLTKPSRPHFVFYATDFDTDHYGRNQIVKRIITRVTAMPCLLGEDIRQGQIQATIAGQIGDAFVMIADITADNLNTCIEAGIARGANTPLHLISLGPRRRPPFMFRDQQVWYFNDDVQLLGNIHKIVFPYRRRTINFEFPQSLYG